MSTKIVNKIDECIQFIINFSSSPITKPLDEIIISWPKNADNDDDDFKDAIQQTNVFYRQKHIDFILRLQQTEESYEYCQTEHLRMQVLYWALCGLDLLNSLHHISQTHIKDEILTFVDACWIEKDGGFGGNILHDVHLLNTLSAIQILFLLKSEKYLEDKRKKIISFLASLQNKETGSFMGDKWGEIDTRFTYAALNALSLLNGLDAIDLKLCKEYINKCKNFDGGYGTKPGAESHAGMIFCCVGSLAIINGYDVIDVNQLNGWLCERQVMKLDNLDLHKYNPLNNGGLNGRPMKLPDVCYSWWCLSAMKICDKIIWINKKHLVQFILNAQDIEDGGISDRPGDLCDIYHTYFGIGGLSLLGCGKELCLKDIDPIWALPTDVCRRIGLYERHKYADVDYSHDVVTLEPQDTAKKIEQTVK